MVPSAGDIVRIDDTSRRGPSIIIATPDPIKQHRGKTGNPNTIKPMGRCAYCLSLVVGGRCDSCGAPFGEKQ